jgi:hypothetical protein
MNATNLLWKATRPNGTTDGDGRGQCVHWAVGETVTHPTSTAMVRDEPATYLSCSAVPAATLVGGSWPCRLFQIRPLGEVIGSDDFPHKRCTLSCEVVAEVEPWRALGPNGRQVAALIDRAGRLTRAEAERLGAARNAAGGVAWDAAWHSVWDAAGDAGLDAARRVAGAAARNATRAPGGVAAWDAAWHSVWDAAGDAAQGAVVRDLITAKQYELLAGPFESVVGPIETLPVPAWVDASAPGRASTRG